MLKKISWFDMLQNNIILLHASALKIKNYFKNLTFNSLGKKIWFHMVCEQKSSFNINWKKSSAQKVFQPPPPDNEMVAP